ncbi:MAG: AraC family ligand binding domain-containing protein, partial [Victivallaceae bacterium]
MTNLPPVMTGFRIDPKHPVIPLAMEVKNVGCAAPHAHPRGQLIYASKGVMRVNCAAGIWFVPPFQAVWMPPQMEHQVYFPAAVSVRSLFIDPSATTGLPESCCVVNVSPLLRELILRAMTFDENYCHGNADWRIMMVILDELRQMKPVALSLPLAQNKQVRQVIDALLASPGNSRTL